MTALRVTWRPSAFVSVVLAATILTACAGGDDGTPVRPIASPDIGTPAAIDPDRDLSERELAAMALHEADLGQLALGMQAGLGWSTSIHGSQNIDEEGLVRSYSLTYEAREYDATILDAGSELSQWRDEYRAREVVAALLAGLPDESFSGERCVYDVRTLAGLGDDATLVRYADPCDPGAIVWTHVYVRTGRIIGEVIVRRTDGVDATEDVQRLARSLAGRISRVKSGDLGRPAGVPDLSAAVIDVGDIESGARFILEQYYTDSDGLSSFERVLAPRRDSFWITLPDSGVRVLVTVAHQYDSVELASRGFEDAVDRFHTFAGAFQGDVDEAPLGLGDEAVMLIVAWSNPEYPPQMDTIVVPMIRVGSVVAYIQAVGCNGVPECGPGIHAESLENLAAAMAERLERTVPLE
jgi:hypothetical protein